MGIMKRECANDLALYVALAVFTGFVGYLSLGEGFSFDVYTSITSGDGVLSGATTKSIQENGLLGMYFNPRLGAPGISTLLDWPAMDPLMGFVIWIISLTGISTPAVNYWYYVITFAITAVSMALLLRRLGIRYEICFLIGAIFAFLPGHFLREMTGHTTLMNYMGLPISVYLSLYIMGFFSSDKIWKPIVCCILLGLGYGYFYAFGLILIALSLVYRAIDDKSLRNALRLLWIPLLVLLFVVISLSPKIIYSAMHGANTLAGKRTPYEQEYYGLKIIQMLLAPSYSRIPFLAEMTSVYNESAPLVTENSFSSLGLIASLGFFGILTLALVRLASRKSLSSVNWRITAFLIGGTLTLLLMSFIGGFGELFNMFVTAQIRCYNRSSFYVAGLSLVLLAIVLNHFIPKRLLVSSLASVALLGLSMFDTVYIQPSDWQKDTAALQAEYDQYFDTVESVLGTDAMVYQLPYYPFPENGPFDYKHFCAYLLTDGIHWSYGGVKGRDSASADLMVEDGGNLEFLANIKEAGFDAVYIDIAGFEDEGENMLAFYNNLNIEPLVSQDGTLYLYDIRGLDVRLPEEP